MEAPQSALPNRIIYDNDTRFRTNFSVTRNSLTITSGCVPADGGASIYRRMSGGSN